MDNIYHICSKEAWQVAKKNNSYRSESLDLVGFIHCSKYNQVLRVANAFYRGQKDLYLLEIVPALVTAKILWEPGSDKPDELFPHIYGALNLSAVKKVFEFDEGPDGQFLLPPLNDTENE